MGAVAVPQTTQLPAVLVEPTAMFRSPPGSLASQLSDIDSALNPGVGAEKRVRLLLLASGTAPQVRQTCGDRDDENANRSQVVARETKSTYCICVE